jgi:hypothetical protein
VRRTLPAAVLATIVLFGVAAGSADAASLHGRILGPPAVAGGHARVSVLLDSGAPVTITVPARSGFRTASAGRTTAGGTRLGDVVSARVGWLRTGDRASAAYLKIERRSAAPTFDDLAARLGASAAGAQRAGDELARIAKAPQGGPQDPGMLRLFLLRLRTQLNLLIADLRMQASGMDDVRSDVGGPAADELIARLRRTAGGARSAATKLERGVAGLDEFINSIGGLNGRPLPAGPAEVIDRVLAAAQQTIDQVAPLVGVPAPKLPAPPPLPPPPVAVPVP